MPYRVLLKRSAEKELEALPPKFHDKAIKALSIRDVVSE
jgi:mRNA-degrading endonuclease RelE of RelBE toxin-antitoxin system